MFTEHTDAVYSVAVGQNFVVSGGGDDLAYIWNPYTLEVIAKLEGHTDSVVSVAISQDESLIATGGMDGKCLIWSYRGELLRQLEGEEIVWVTFMENDVVVGRTDGCVQKEHKMVYNHTGPVNCARINQNQMVTGGQDGSMILLDSDLNVKFRWTKKDPRWMQGEITCVDISANIAVAGGQGVRVVNQSGTITFSLPNDQIECVRIGRFLCIGGLEQPFLVFDHGRMTPRLVLDHEDVVCCEILSDGIATGCLNGIVKTWSLDGTLREEYEHQDCVLDMKANKVLVSASQDSTLLVNK